MNASKIFGLCVALAGPAIALGCATAPSSIPTGDDLVVALDAGYAELPEGVSRECVLAQAENTTASYRRQVIYHNTQAMRAGYLPDRWVATEIGSDGSALKLTDPNDIREWFAAAFINHAVEQCQRSSGDKEQN